MVRMEERYYRSYRNKSKKFREKLGEGGNYGIVIKNYMSYESPRLLSEFMCNGKVLVRAPSNMISVELVENRKGEN